MYNKVTTRVLKCLDWSPTWRDSAILFWSIINSTSLPLSYTVSSYVKSSNSQLGAAGPTLRPSSKLGHARAEPGGLREWRTWISFPVISSRENAACTSSEPHSRGGAWRGTAGGAAIGLPYAQHRAAVADCGVCKTGKGIKRKERSASKGIYIAKRFWIASPVENGRG